MKLSIITFILRLMGSLTLLIFKLTGVYLVETWRKRAAVKAFRRELIRREVPKEGAQTMARQYASMVSLRKAIEIARSLAEH